MEKHGHSEACCTLPPVVVKDYKPKGEYVDIAGYKTYVTGPKNAKTAILMIYDIFGISEQVLQGADLLAIDRHQIYMPDLFHGKPADLSWFPPDNKEKEEKLGNFFSTTGAPPPNAEKIVPIVKGATEYSGDAIKKWGVVGLCWGGKIVSLTSGPGTLFSVCAACHPAMVNPEEAKGITIPMCMLPSKDENQEDVKNFEKELTAPRYFETFPTQIHGFMGARGDLENPEVYKEYSRAYQIVLDFFHKHL